MAVDTAVKRFSLIGLGHSGHSPVFIPDGSVDAGDRYDLIYLYAGITLAEPPEPVAAVQPCNVATVLGSRYVSEVLGSRFSSTIV